MNQDNVPQNNVPQEFASGGILVGRWNGFDTEGVIRFASYTADLCGAVNYFTTRGFLARRTYWSVTGDKPKVDRFKEILLNIMREENIEAQVQV